MRSLVIDASVAAKWILPAGGEPLKPEALRLLDDYGAGDVELIVPDIFWAECGSIVWKAVKRQRLPQLNAEQALELMMRREIPTVPSKTLLTDATHIAFDFGCSVYDSLYVALASKSKIQLITADERLANALAARFPVKWLGAY